MAKKVTEAAAKAAMKEWIENDLQLANVQAQKRSEVTPIVQKYESEERELMDRRQAAEAVLEKWATENRDTILPGDAKSTNFEGGKIGFKKSPAKLALIDEAGDWDEVIEKVKKVLPEFVLSKMELDKSGILRNADGLNGKLGKAGLQIVQDEKFYVKV